MCKPSWELYKRLDVERWAEAQQEADGCQPLAVYELPSPAPLPTAIDAKAGYKVQVIDANYRPRILYFKTSAKAQRWIKKSGVSCDRQLFLEIAHVLSH